MKLSSALLSFLVPSMMAKVVLSQCSKEVNINLEAEKSSTQGPCDRAGRVRFAWKTINIPTNVFGNGDEYFVQLRQGSVLLYNEGQFNVDTNDISGFLGDTQEGPYTVRFVCTNESQNCDGGRFSYKIIDCGCPPDKPNLIQECKADFFETAKDAVCLSFSDAPVEGNWTNVGSGQNPEFSLTESVTFGQSTTITETDTTTFSQSITAGFEFKAVSASVSVGFEQSSSVSSAVTETFEKTTAETFSTSCSNIDTTTGYAIWQWTMGQPDDSSGIGFNIKTSHFECTRSITEIPRCPLGFCAFDDPICQTCREPFEDLSIESPDPEDDETDPGCFSGETMVKVLDTTGGEQEIPMRSLNIGDYVRVGNGRFSRVYSFIHLDPELEADFLQITAEGLEHPLEVTAEHMVFVSGKAVRASQVQVGDVLGTRSKVVRIEPVKRLGVYAPATDAGDIVASGVRASSYVAVLDQVAPALQHAVFHAALAPHRLACSLNFAACERETYTEGISDWIFWATRFLSGLNDQAALVQVMAMLVLVPFVAALYLVENLFLYPVLGATVIAGIKYYREQATTSKLAHKTI